MPWFDLPLAALREHRTATEEPARLDKWWAARLDEARAAARPAMATRYQTDTYGPLHAYDVEFSGARGDRIRGW
jgi:cephalosporin-C deacetylase